MSIPLYELQAKLVADHAVERLSAFNRRTLDTIAARIYYILSIAAEALGSLSSIRRLAMAQQWYALFSHGPISTPSACPCSTLLSLHCTAVLRHDSTGQEMLMNLILRNYLHYNLYDQVRRPLS